MKSTPKIELTASSQLRKVVFGTSRMVTKFRMLRQCTARGQTAESTKYFGGILAAVFVFAAVAVSAQTITWTGNINGNWDFTTTNWLDAASAPATYQDSEDVVFDDTATGTITVTLTSGDWAPSSVTVANTSKAYTFNGSGALTGAGSLTKSGDNTLTIANTGSNSFSGGVTISGGIVRLSGSADRLPNGTSVTLADAPGAALDLNNQNQTIFTLSGGGSTGGNISLGSGTLTLKGGGVYAGQISGSGKVAVYGASWAILNGASTYSGGTYFAPNSLEQIQNTSGSGTGTGNVTLDDSAEICFGNVFRTPVTPSVGIVGAPAVTNGFTLNKAILLLSRNDDFIFEPVLYGGGYIYYTFGYGRTILNHANFHFGTGLASFGPVRINHSNALGTGEFWSGGVAAAGLELGNNITVTNLIQLNGKATALEAVAAANIINVTGTNTLAGPLRFDPEGNDWVFRSDAGKLVIANSSPNDTRGGTHNFWLRGAADGEVVNGFLQSSSTGAVRNLYKDDAGTWILKGASTYAGFTAISNGTLVVNGSINPATNAPDTRVLVTGAGTLGGTGTIAPEVVVFDGGTLAPGASIGTLTINNNLTLTNCTCVFELAASGGVVSCDQVSGIVNLTNAGAVTLQATLTGSVIGGEVFHLFNAAAYYGTFDSFNLPPLTGGLSWITNQLSVDGTLRVSGGANIKVTQFSYVHGGNFQMSGTSSATNSPYRILATTNLANPSSWIQVGSGTFANGVFSFTDLNSASFQSRYYRVATP